MSQLTLLTGSDSDQTGTERQVCHVYVLDSGNCISFDGNNEMYPAFCGTWALLKDRINRVAPNAVIHD